MSGEHRRHLRRATRSRQAAEPNEPRRDGPWHEQVFHILEDEAGPLHQRNHVRTPPEKQAGSS